MMKMMEMTTTMETTEEMTTEETTAEMMATTEVMAATMMMQHHHHQVEEQDLDHRLDKATLELQLGPHAQVLEVIGVSLHLGLGTGFRLHVWTQQSSSQNQKHMKRHAALSMQSSGSRL
jgi:hypothetical protein